MQDHFSLVVSKVSILFASRLLERYRVSSVKWGTLARRFNSSSIL